MIQNVKLDIKQQNAEINGKKTKQNNGMTHRKFPATQSKIQHMQHWKTMLQLDRDHVLLMVSACVVYDGVGLSFLFNRICILVSMDVT